MNSLVADIGGTKTLLSVLEKSTNGLTTRIEARYPCDQFESFDDLLTDFYQAYDIPKISYACFAVAGPIIQLSENHQTVNVTNLPWKLDNHCLQTKFDLPELTLINDFQAIGYGVESLKNNQLVTLQTGKKQAKEPIAIIGAGTGLGQCFLYWNGNQYQVHATEGGHVDFAPTNEEQLELLKWLQCETKPIAFEHVLSGPGIYKIYQFFAQQYPSNQLEHLKVAEDPSAIISQLALTKKDPCAERTMKLFVECYGSQAGNLALSIVPKGGLFIAGGIASKIINLMTEAIFMTSFLHKDQMKSVLQTIPVHIVTDSNIGLMGAGVYSFIPQKDKFCLSR